MLSTSWCSWGTCLFRQSVTLYTINFEICRLGPWGIQKVLALFFCYCFVCTRCCCENWMLQQPSLFLYWLHLWWCHLLVRFMSWIFKLLYIVKIFCVEFNHSYSCIHIYSSGFWCVDEKSDCVIRPSQWPISISSVGCHMSGRASSITWCCYSTFSGCDLASVSKGENGLHAGDEGRGVSLTVEPALLQQASRCSNKNKKM